MALVISLKLYKTESLRLQACQKENVTEYRILQKNKQYLPTCIIRVTSLSDHGRFTALSQVSDTLGAIQVLRNADRGGGV